MRKSSLRGWFEALGFARRLGRLRAVALAAVAISGFGACSDSSKGVSDEVESAQSALSGGADPVVRYWFNEISGALASDSSGNGHAATLVNGASFVPGARGNAVRIAGGNQRVDLPQGVVSACQDLTIAMRVNLASNTANWARIFDFGTGPAVNMFLTPRASGNVLRFAITTGGGAAEQQISYAYNFPISVWKHVAIVLNGNTGTLYLDGQQVAQNPNLTLNPLDLGLTTSNWLGRSQYAADPTLNGSIDDVLVSCRAYSAFEVGWLAAGDPVAKYKFDETGSVTAADSSGNARHATLSGGASFVPGLTGNAVRIAGGTQRVNLPAGIVQSCTDLTIAAHIRLTTNTANWARVFDIGSGVNSYMFLTPRAGAANVLRFAITTGGNGAEQRLSYTYNFPTSLWKHVAIVLSGNTGTMYLDGVQVAQSAITLNPSALGATASNLLGDSQFTADPTLDGSIDNLLVSCRAHSPAEIGALSGACTSAANCNDNNPCTTDTCNAGFCAHSTLADGTSCADASVCNGAEACQSGWCAAGTPPVVDDGNACTTDACHPTQGVTHTPITGCGGGAGAGGSAQSGSGGAGGASGSAGSGGSAGSAGGMPVEFFVDLPTGVDTRDVTLAAYGGFVTMNDGAILSDPSTGGYSSASSVRTAHQTELGVSAALNHLWSVPNVFLRNNSRVLGDLTTAGTATLQAGAQILGARREQTSLEPIRRISWQVVFSSGTPPSIHLEPGQAQTITPGGYGNLELKSGARLVLATGGRYTVRTLVMHPASVLEIDNSVSAVEIYTRDGFNFSGAIEERAPARHNVLFGHASASGVSIEKPFRGVLVAPAATVSLATTSQGHDASVFANSVVLHQWTSVRQKPFVPENFCDPSSNECNGLCPCSTGKGCQSDADCAAGLVCAPGMGPAFGGEPGTNACWPSKCAQRTESDSSTCGTLNHPCGLCEVPPRPCNGSSDCAAGETCTEGNGALFGLGVSSVCWATSCTTAARANHCGSVKAPCGLCTCSSTCVTATCGGTMENGCGTECPNLCADRQPGCTLDVHCGPGSVCVIGGGPRVGLAAGTNVCLPRICADHDLSRVPCGGTGSACGSCPACTPNCEGRCSGPDGCGGSCAASCAPDEECTGNGFCLGTIDTTSVEIPNGLGGERTVPPLDPGPTSSVGVLPGVFGITDTGKSTYRIPIKVPPGRAGIQPGLSLTYGGTLRNGILGVGWHLEGLSSITRCRHTENRDGYSAPVADDRTDRYCLDGVQLVPGVEEDYGADGAIHFPEFDPRTRVVSFGTRPSGPDWFEVRRSNGLVYTYGRSARSSAYSDTDNKREWALERVEDRVGNYMTIGYAKFEELSKAGQGEHGPVILPTVDTREMVPVSIKYTGFSSDGLSPSKLSRSVTLTYDNDRPDRLTTFLAGHATMRTRRLKKISTTLGLLGSSTARTYDITYGDEIGEPAQNGASRIARVQECGGDGVCQPATAFDYFDDASVPFGATQASEVFLRGDPWRRGSRFPTTPAFLQRTRNRLVDEVMYGYGFEFSRDGGCDILGCEHTIHPSVGWARVGWPVLPLNHRDFGRSNDITHAPYTHCDGTVSSEQAHLGPLGDFDLDGTDDVLDYWTWTRNHLRVLRGAAFQPEVVDPFPFFPACNSRRITTFHGVAADITGDGLADIVHCQVSDNSIKLYERVGRSAFLQGVTLASRGNCGEESSSVYDLDGDGTSNLARDGATLAFRGEAATTTWEEGVFPFPRGHTVAAGKYVDLNGDGLKDFVAVEADFTTEGSGLVTEIHKTESTRVRMGTGRGFVESPRGSVVVPSSQLRWAIPADVNHDGMEELLMPLVTELTANTNAPPNAWRVVGFGGGGPSAGLVELLRFDTHVPLRGGSPFVDVDQSHHAVMADLDGDGADDLFMVGPSNEKRVFVLPGNGRIANLLKTVTDGVGKRIEVNYSTGAHTPGTDCFPLRCDTRPGPLVSHHSVAQVGPPGMTPRTERQFDYRYTDGRTNPADKKFLGFANRTITERRGIVNELIRFTEIELDNNTNFGDVYPTAGRRIRVRVTEPQTVSPLASGLSTSRVTDTFFNWEPSFASHSGVVARLESRETRSIELLSGGEERRIHTVFEDFDTDHFGNIEKTVRTEFTPAKTLTTTTIETLYRPEAAEHLDAWLIALPERRTVTDRVEVTPPIRTQTRRSDFTYYPGTNLLHHVVREPNDASFRLDTELLRNAQGNVEQVIETTAGPELPRVSRITYDADGTFPQTFTVGSGTEKEQSSYVEFDARFGTPRLVSDPNGVATQWAYDSFGRVTRQLSPTTESVTDYTVDVPRASEILPTFGVMTISTETAGFGRSEVGIDAFGRPVRRAQTGLLGEDVLTETLYDDAGRVARQSRPHAPGVTSQGFVQYDYDFASRLRKVTQADTTAIEFEYASRTVVANVVPELGALPPNYLWFTRTKDPKGNLSLSIADQRGALAASRDTGGAWVLATPGPFGTVPSVNAAGLTSSYEHDRYGRLTRSVDPDRGVERYTYTHYDELFQYFIGNAQTASIEYGYDEVGRMTSMSLSEGGTATYAYGDLTGDLTQIGRLLSITSFDGSRREFAYEEPLASGNRGLLSSVTDIVEGETMTTGFEYNDFGQLTRTRYPGGSAPFAVDRQYDAGGNVRLIGSENFAETYWELLGTHQGYLPSNERYGGTNASTTSLVGHEYEALTGRVHRLTSRNLGGLFQDVEHVYDPNGNLEFRIDNQEPLETRTEQYAYDNRDRLTDHFIGLTQVTHIDYTPDGNGNIQHRSDLGAYNYAPIPNRPAHMPSSAGNIAYGYDQRTNGNVTSRVASGTEQNFTYDSTGMPTRIAIAGDNNAVQLKYHATGERSAKLLSNQRRVFYSGDYERETLPVPSSNEHRYRIYTPFGPMGEIVRTESGTELSRTYWHKDVLGSPEVLTNAGAGVIHRQKFSAFGRSNNPTWEASDPAVRRVRRGYTGHEHDPETGLVNMGARLYDNVTARFMAPDPTVQVPGWTQSWNRFSYAWNSPMNWVDPTGLENASVGADPNGDPVITFPDDPLTGSVPDATVTDPGYTLNDFYPASNPADALPESPVPMTSPVSQPSSITQGPEGQLIEQILADALEGSDCDPTMASCGPTAGERTLANSSNMLNRTQVVPAEDLARQRRSAEFAANDRPLETPLVSPLDFVPTNLLAGMGVGLGKVAVAGTARALVAADLGLTGRGIAKLSGNVINSGTTRIIHVSDVRAISRGVLVGELRRAVPNMLSSARAGSVQTLQITGSFANVGLGPFAAHQAALHGGTFSSVGGVEALTFILR